MPAQDLALQADKKKCSLVSLSMRRSNTSGYYESNFLPTLRSATLTSHVGTIAMISFMLTNAIMKAVAGSTSSGHYSPALFR